MRLVLRLYWLKVVTFFPSAARSGYLQVPFGTCSEVRSTPLTFLTFPTIRRHNQVAYQGMHWQDSDAALINRVYLTTELQDTPESPSDVKLCTRVAYGDPR